MDWQIVKPASPAEYRRYAAFAGELFEGNPHWRGGGEERLAAEISNRSPYAAHARAQPFWVERQGEIQAVVTAMVDDSYNAHRNEKAGFLLAFDARPERAEEAAALLEEASGWLKKQGAAYARFGFKFGWQLPLTIDSYDVPPTLFHAYNPPYYHAYVKNAGFRMEKGAVELRVSFTPELADRYARMAGVAGVALRAWDLSRLEEENRLFVNLFNETFAGHWGCGRFREEEMAGLTVGMREVLVPELCWFAEVDGEPAGFVYSLPDLNQGHDITYGVLLIIGVREKFRGRGVNMALGGRCFLGMIGRGYRSASYTIVLDDNWPSRRTAEKLGCRVARNYCIYRRELTEAIHLPPQAAEVPHHVSLGGSNAMDLGVVEK